MTALERAERLKENSPLCPTCAHAQELITTLACGISGKVILPRYPKRTCENYEKRGGEK